MEKESEEYVSYYDRVESAKIKIKEDLAKKQQVKPEGQRLSELQVRWAEATISLIDNDSFKTFLELEKSALNNALRLAYMPRNTNQKMSYGENMAYNEGYYAGLMHVKLERENIWNKYLAYLKNKHGEKNEN